MTECREDLRTPWGKAFTLIALLLLFSFGSSWAECVPANLSRGTNAEMFCKYAPETGCTQEETNCEGEGQCEIPCDSTTTLYGEIYTGVTLGNSRCIWIGFGTESCGHYWGAAKYSECVYTLKCSNQCEADSVNCVNRGQKWDSKNCECKEGCQDSLWYHCESVYTENNVIRSEVSEYNCDSLTNQRYLLGSCEENGFCSGNGKPGLDSCSYSGNLKCKSSGQSGSLCSYVCSDGSFRSCNIAWTPGQPAEYQPCPSTMPSNCGGRSSSSQGGGSSSSGESSSSEGGSSSSGGDSSSSGGGDEDCPECDILQAIKDTLHIANVQRKVQNDYTLDIKTDVGDISTNVVNIVTNTTVTATRINTSNGFLHGIDSTNRKISSKLDNLDLGNLTATVDSIVVHVDTPSDSSSAPWVFWDLDSLPVWRDTVSDIHRTLDSIKVEIDSLNKDTTGIIGKYLPFLKKMSDKLDDLTGDCEGVECILRPAIDTLVTKMRDSFGLDTLSLEEQDDVEQGIVRLSDSTYVEGNFYCIEHPDDVFCVEVDSTELPTILPPDSFDVARFFEEQDSLKNYIDSVLKDTTQDTLALDELAGDPAKIREKLDFIFLPTETVEQCFEFRLNTALGQWTYNLAIDFADLFGLDLCDLIRKIVRIITFILIVFTTVKGYIKAFGGGGSGGDV